MADVSIKPHMLCKSCGLQKIGRLELIWCNDCAEYLEKRRSP